jgi:hypothetical protein
MDDTSEDPTPIELPKAPSDRDKTMINRMFREAFSYPPTHRQKRYNAQKKRQRSKARKNGKQIE